MNIGNRTNIRGLEKTRCSKGHIAHSLSTKGFHKIKYAYFGPRVQRGVVDILTIYGWQEATFRAENGWITDLEF